MANTLKLKRSAVASKVPAVGDLELGELAVNTYDGKLYTKKDNGTASIVEIGAGGGGGGATNLDGLSDVAITSVATGQFLVYNGTNFVNTRTIDSGGSTPLTTVSSGGTSAEFKSSAGYNGFRVGCNSTTGVPYVALDTNSSQKAYFAYWGDGAARVSLGYSSSTDVINYGTSGTYVGRVGIQTTTPGGQLAVTCASASNKGILVKGAASQSGNLFEAQNSSGTALAYVTSAGEINAANGLTVTGTLTTNTITSGGGMTLSVPSTSSVYVLSNMRTLTQGSPMLMSGAYGLGQNNSTLKVKKDIEPLEQQYADKVLDLQPVWFRSKMEYENPQWSYFGLIAEQVAEVEPRLVNYTPVNPADVNPETGMPDFDAPLEPCGVMYDRIGVLLIDVVKRQRDRIETLEATVSTLESRLKAVEDLIA